MSAIFKSPEGRETVLARYAALLDSHETKRRLERCAPQAAVRLLPDVGHLIRDQGVSLG